MKNIRLFIDFGSTFTKVTAVDFSKEEIIGTAHVPSTVGTDITIGLNEALKEIAASVKIDDSVVKEALACSSAGGGLRMVCAGFVPSLTSRAANNAALGAGAKVIACYSYKLTQEEITEIEAAAPDIVLLAGGTDGGDAEVILHNAGLFSRTGPAINNIIVAGNKATHDRIKALFDNLNKNVVYTGNVMPEIGVLDTAPSNREIRRLFMKNIIEAKGVARAREIIGDVIMPTPAAVLEAARLIAEGYSDSPGMGEVIVIDVGGATTDVHSVAKGKPSQADTIVAGLPEPYAKRTVEGDLGLKYNLDKLLELAGDALPGFESIVAGFHEGKLPETEAERECQRRLTGITVKTAVDRHAGRLEVVFTPDGERLIQHGKDLTRVRTVIGTGGPIIHSNDPSEILKNARFDESNTNVLKPKTPEFYLDEKYILFAVGLLGQSEPKKALAIAGKYLKKIR